MKSYWGSMGPSPSMTGVLERRRGETQANRHMKSWKEVEIEVMHLQAKKHQGQQEAGKSPALEPSERV